MPLYEITYYKEIKYQRFIKADNENIARQLFLNIESFEDKNSTEMRIEKPTIEIENIKPLEEENVRNNAH